MFSSKKIDALELITKVLEDSEEIRKKKRTQNS